MIIIARHGETEWNIKKLRQGQQDSPLTEKGITQATVLGDMVVKLDPEVIYASPLGRVVDTLRIMRIGLDEVNFDDRLMEMHFGKSEGKMAGGFHHLWNVPFYGGESYEDVYKRVYEFLLDIPTEKDVLIVAHETVNKMIVGNLLRLSPQEITKMKQPNGLVWII